MKSVRDERCAWLNNDAAVGKWSSRQKEEEKEEKKEAETRTSCAPPRFPSVLLLLSVLERACLRAHRVVVVSFFFNEEHEKFPHLNPNKDTRFHAHIIIKQSHKRDGPKR